MSIEDNSQRKVQVERLFQIEDRLIDVARRYDLELHKFPRGLMDQLLILPPESIDFAEQNLINVVNTLETNIRTDSDPWDDTEFFQLSMRVMGMRYPSDFLNHIEQGDVIEGYDLSRRQIFRNMRFMEVSGYSLMEVLSFEWTKLYERSDEITGKMISFCDAVLWEANKTIPFEVPTHLTRELMSDCKTIFELRFKFLAPLFSGPNKPCGMLGNMSATVLQAEVGQRYPGLRVMDLVRTPDETI